MSSSAPQQWVAARILWATTEAKRVARRGERANGRDRKPTNEARMIRTAICDLFGIQHPIVLGGMGAPNTSPEIVAAVCNAGGLGVLGCSGRSAGEVGDLVRRIRELTDHPFGLNLLLFMDERETLQAMVEARPRVLSFAWPRPDQPLPEIFSSSHAAGAKVMHMVSQASEAARAARAGADVIVAQGSEGGGHVGTMGSLALVPQVVDAVRPTPVVAAGGIADGRGLAAALALGAAGALLGTRFVASVEAPQAQWAKEAIIGSDGHDTDLTEIPDIITGRVWPGAFGRAWRNDLIRRWAGREWEVRQRRGEIGEAVAAARAAGDAQGVPLLFGQDAGLITSIEPAADIVARIVREAEAVIDANRAFVAEG